MSSIDWNNTLYGDGQITINGITTLRILQINVNDPLSKGFDPLVIPDNQQIRVESSRQHSAHVWVILRAT